MVKKTPEKKLCGRRTTSVSGSKNYPIAIASCSKTPKKAKNSNKPMKAKAKRQTKPQYRSNLNGVILLFNSLELNESQLDCLRLFCPFWELIKLILEENITKRNSRKSDVDIRHIVGCFNKKTKRFHIGGKELAFTRADLVKKFGITGGADPIAVEGDIYDGSIFYANNFTGITSLSTSILSQKVNDEAGKENLANWNNFCQLTTFYLLSALFTPTKGSTVTWGYTKYLNIVQNIKNYDWASHIFDKLHESLCTFNTPEDVIGCVMALPYWVMENFAISPAANNSAILLCQKWDLKTMTSKTKSTIITNLLETKPVCTEVTNHSDPCDKTNEILVLESGEENDISNEILVLESDEEAETYSKERNCTAYNFDEDEVVEPTINLKDDSTWMLPTITRDCSIVSSAEYEDTLKRKILDLEALLHNMGHQMLELREEKEVKEKEWLIMLNSKEAEFKDMKTILEALIKTKDLEIRQISDELACKNISMENEINLVENLRDQIAHLTLNNSELKNIIINLEAEAIEIAIHQVTQSARIESNLPPNVVDDYEVHPNPESADSVNNTTRANDFAILEDMPNFNLHITQEIVNCKLSEETELVNPNMETKIHAKPTENLQALVCNSPPSRVKRLKIRNDRKARKSDTFFYEDDDFQPSAYPDPLSVDKNNFVTNEIFLLQQARPVAAQLITVKSPVADFLSDENLKKLGQMERINLIGENVCSFPHNIHAYVKMEDIYKILQDKGLSSNVINVYAELLTHEYYSNPAKKFSILDSTNWTYIRTAGMSRDNNKRNRLLFVDEFIIDRDKSKWDFLFFPINTNGNKGVTTKVKHWSLLVFDSIKPEWKFYNSIMGMNEYSDPYTEDARRVKEKLCRKEVEGLCYSMEGTILFGR